MQLQNVYSVIKVDLIIPGFLQIQVIIVTTAFSTLKKHMMMKRRCNTHPNIAISRFSNKTLATSKYKAKKTQATGSA